MPATTPALGALETQTRQPGAVDLFTFSAAIGMAHRIHYDADYTRDVEGHPALVVQGPLQAAYICQVLHAWGKSQGSTAQIERLKYRHRKPVYVDQALVIGGEVVSFDEATGRAQCAVWVKFADDDTIATDGEATVALVAR